MTEDSLSHRLAQYACDLAYEDLTKSQVHKIKLHLLDWVGTAYAGKDQAPVQIMLDAVVSLGGHPEATLIPSHTKTMCLLAAMLNSASSCLMEMDDLHRASIFHPASVVIPAALCVAESKHSTGRELIAAIVAGYEVGIRVALAVGPSHYEFWHTTATCGTFGAAAAAAKVLGLYVDGAVWALGSAGTQTAGLWAFLVESAMSKPLHVGKAPFNGVLAALLAQRGFSGARRILEGEKGFFRATSRDYDGGRALAGLGHELLFEQTSLKFYPSCGHTHSAIDALLLATGANPMRADEIERIEVYVYQAALDLLEKVEPTTPTQAKFNLPFCVATAVRRGTVELRDFEPSRLTDPEIHHLMERTTVHSAPDLTRMYPDRWAARVVVETANGNRLEALCENPKGDPENPLTEDQVIKKFKDLTEGALSVTEADRLVERVMNLEKLNDVADLLTD